MSRFANLVAVSTATTGTGTVTLGSAISNRFLTPTQAGMVDGGTYTYELLDGTDIEIGRGVYTSSGTTFTRATVLVSKISGTSGTTKLTLSGSAVFRIISAAEDVDISGFTATAWVPGYFIAGSAAAGDPRKFNSFLTPFALTDGATITPSLANGTYQTVTIAATGRTLANPSAGMSDSVGCMFWLKVKQDATGSRTITTYGSQYDFGQDTAPTLTTTAAAEDLLGFFIASSTKLVYTGIRKDIG